MAVIIYVLAFVGGFSIMSLELLGGRVLAPYFGSSIYVWGSIITVFMLSLSIGYLIGGRLSLHHPSLGRFALIFLAAAICLYPLVYFSRDIMNVVFERVEDPRYGSLLTSSILFIVPTVIMGMISPYSVRMLVRTPGTPARWPACCTSSPPWAARSAPWRRPSIWCSGSRSTPSSPC
jgi:hypothetical protein